jgi:hypothetical protein
MTTPRKGTWRVSQGKNENNRILAELANRLPLTDAEFARLARQMPDGEEVWLEWEVGSWVVAGRVLGQGGRPAIAEVRLFPNEPLRLWPGRWSERPEDVPAGGITTETWRFVQIGALRAGIQATPSDAAATAGVDEKLINELKTELAEHPGVTGRPDAFYAKLASAYVSELEAGNPQPVSVLAPRLGKSPAVLRNMLRDARQRSLLTAAKGRKAGGRLTAKAQRLLNREEDA